MVAVVTWQCSACGNIIYSSLRPSGKAGGRCPDTSSGNHMWQQQG